MPPRPTSSGGGCASRDTTPGLPDAGLRSSVHSAHALSRSALRGVVGAGSAVARAAAAQHTPHDSGA
eukprot:12702090-Alexandrium_andersonii.AAC.1